VWFCYWYTFAPEACEKARLLLLQRKTLRRLIEAIRVKGRLTIGTELVPRAVSAPAQRTIASEGRVPDGGRVITDRHLSKIHASGISRLSRPLRPVSNLGYVPTPGDQRAVPLGT
jgi:hypothetical protein